MGQRFTLDAACSSSSFTAMWSRPPTAAGACCPKRLTCPPPSARTRRWPSSTNRAKTNPQLRRTDGNGARPAGHRPGRHLDRQPICRLAGHAAPAAAAKGEGWPQYMQTEAWAKRSLASFLGSWAELKHDTALYAKQVYGEMGGGRSTPRTTAVMSKPNPPCSASWPRCARPRPKGWTRSAGSARPMPKTSAACTRSTNS